MKKGFTLIEIIVGISLLTIGVLGVAYFFAHSVGITRYASNNSVASNLGQGVIDEELAKSYDELTPGSGTKTKFSNVTTNPFYNFSWKVDVTYIDSNLATSGSDLGLKKIDVHIYWNEGSSEKNLQLSTIKTKR